MKKRNGFIGLVSLGVIVVGSLGAGLIGLAAISTWGSTAQGIIAVSKRSEMHTNKKQYNVRGNVIPVRNQDIMETGQRAT